MKRNPNLSGENKDIESAKLIAIPILKTVQDCISFAEEANPRKEPLTVETLRKFPGCQGYSDKEAANIVQTIHQLTAIIFNSVSENCLRSVTDENKAQNLAA